MTTPSLVSNPIAGAARRPHTAQSPMARCGRVALMLGLAGLGALACGGERRERPTVDAGSDASQDAPDFDVPPTGDDRPRKACAVDVLFVIDNSGSMAEEQVNLSMNFKAMVEVLKDLQGGLPNIHIGVVSSDLGTGKYNADSKCNATGGDRGVLQNQQRKGDCKPVKDRYLESFANGTQNNFEGDLGDAFACIAQLGTGGCGLEHQIGALKAALEPTNTENVGFLRPGADLALVLITDEDDCTAPPDSDLFSPGGVCGMGYGPMDSYRCTQFGIVCDGVPPPASCTAGAFSLENCHSAEESGKLVPIKEMADWFKALKADTGGHVMVAALAGDPTPVKITAGPGAASLLMPSCETPTTGKAMPGVRIKDFVDEFGERGLYESICTGDFSDAMRRIGELIRTNLGTLEC